MPDLRRTEFWGRAVVAAMRRAGRGFAAAALMLGAVACTEGDGPYRLPPPPSEADRAGFGQVMLVVPGAPIPEKQMPVGQAEDAAGAAILGGAGAGAYGAGVMAASPPVILGAALFPPAAFVGAAVAVGAAAGIFATTDVSVPENIKQEIDALVLAEWTEFGTASGAQRRLAAAAARVTGRPAANTPQPVAAVAGVASVLTIQITQLGLTITKPGLAEQGGGDPMLRLAVSIEATLTGAGSEELHALKRTYVGPKHPFSHWRADDGQALQDEFARVFDAIGERVYEDLFLLWLPQPPTEVTEARRG